MSKRSLFLIIIVVILGGAIGLLFILKNSSSRTLNAQPLNEKGCLLCHDGIETINIRMQPYLLAFAQQQYGKGEGYDCAICHEGNPSSDTEDAHKGLIPNPSSMWVLHQGKGCSKCHDGKESITTLMGRRLPKPVGGGLAPMPVISSDPSGSTGIGYTYRMARALMSLETGKANKILSSNGIIPKGKFPYANFNMDDPDGPVPRVGSEKYREWVKKAIDARFLKRLEKVEEIPDFQKAVKTFGSVEKAGFADIHRKQCARCHVWGEGRDKRGDLRASGCAACHMLYGNDGKYEGNDLNIKNNKTRPHALKHKITNAIPATQCTHCHTRGKRIGTTFVGMFEYDYIKDGAAPPFDNQGKPQEPLFTKEYLHVKEDIHFERGMDCADCHTSIDVHGDGNIYPVTYYQVEISCYDCHGSTEKYPWELPVGYGTPVTLEGERGTYRVGGKEYLLTSRGNAKGSWVREGKRVYVLSRYTGKRHEAPLLKNIKLADQFKTQQGKVAMATIPQHLEKMECYTCHSTWAPQCYGCHMRYDRRVKGTDWVATSKRLDSKTGRQVVTKTFGDLTIENRSFFRWETPISGVNLKGRVSPLIPGCQVFYTFIDEKGKIKALNKYYMTSGGHASPTLAPLFPHSVTLIARTCEDCHTNPKAIGYGTANSRSGQKLLRDAPLFQDLSKGVYGDIPGAKTGKWQVPKIEDFPNALDQLVTRSGKQVQNMPLPEDRPLSEKERNLVEREGLCVGCHQYYGTPEWARVVEKYGKAETAERHDKIVSEAIKSLMEKSR
jgi:hypothetical protein